MLDNKLFSLKKYRRARSWRPSTEPSSEVNRPAANPIRRHLAVMVALIPGVLIFLLLGMLLAFEEISWVAGLLWLTFGLISLWTGLRFSRVGGGAALAYWQATETFSRIVQDTSDQEQLLDQITNTLFETLAVSHLSIWRYRLDDNVLAMLRAAGTCPPLDLTELPFDITLGLPDGTHPVVSLPESALRQGLLSLAIEDVTLLGLGDELIGLIGFGQHRSTTAIDPAARRWLNLMAGQLALVVKNACLVTDLEETITKLQLAYRRTIDAEEEERRHLAIELHDDILSRLSSMSMTLRLNRRRLTTHPLQVEQGLVNLEEEAQYLNRRLREITQGLHPSVLTDLGLIAALQAYLDSIGKQVLPPSAPRVITLTAQGFGDHRIRNQKLETDLYYVSRQAIDNALFHAYAEQILIHLRWGQTAISITVQDTGCGLRDTPEVLMGQTGHLGLLSMNERTLAWRGRLTFDSEPGQGTTIHVRVPMGRSSPALAHLQAFTYHLQKAKTEIV
ncbi:MAG: hypothetical protein KDI79_07220 [Anaerolineae bacterium]|nr:hypothetical protein [Anaerolineae bacterium]